MMDIVACSVLIMLQSAVGSFFCINAKKKKKWPYEDPAWIISVTTQARKQEAIHHFFGFLCSYSVHGRLPFSTFYRLSSSSSSSTDGLSYERCLNH